MAPAPYSAMVLGATGNVGRRIVELLLDRPQCRRVVIATRRPTSFTAPKVTEVIVDMARLEQDLAPYAQGIDVALAAFGVGAGSASMAEDEVRRIEVGIPLAFCRAAKAGGARVAGVMTAAGASPDFAALPPAPGLQAPEVKRLEYREMMAAADGERVS